MIEIKCIKLRDIHVIPAFSAAHKGKLALLGDQIGIVAAESGTATRPAEWFFVPLDETTELLHPDGPAIDVSEFFELFVEELALVRGIPDSADFLRRNHVYDWDVGKGCIKLLCVGNCFVCMSRADGFECGDLIADTSARDKTQLLRIGRLILRPKD